jgi:hypothetical protein
METDILTGYQLLHVRYDPTLEDNEKTQQGYPTDPASLTDGSLTRTIYEVDLDLATFEYPGFIGEGTATIYGPYNKPTKHEVNKIKTKAH